MDCFEDDEFPATDGSIGLKDTNGKSFIWLRPCVSNIKNIANFKGPCISIYSILLLFQEIVSEDETEAFVVDGADRFDVCQGTLSKYNITDF